MRKLLLILGIVLWTSQLWAATYYIDPTCSSSGDGTTTTCGTHGPFKTWAKVPWAAGNTYSQKGGTIYYGTIDVGASGRAGNPITINSYGTCKAKLSGLVTVPASSWSGPDANGVYKQPSLGYYVVEDGILLKNKAVARMTQGTKFYEWGGASPTYYKPTSGTPSNHTVQILRMQAINISDKDYITINGIEMSDYGMGVDSGNLLKGQSNQHITVTNCAFSQMLNGIRIMFNNTDRPNQIVSSGHIIQRNTFEYNSMSMEFVSMGEPPVAGVFDNVEISYNTITNGGRPRGVTTYDWLDVNDAGWDREGIGFQNVSNSNIHHNSITGHIRGIVLYVCSNGDAIYNNIHHNYIATDLTPVYYQPNHDRSYSGSARAVYGNNLYSNVLVSTDIGFPEAVFAAYGRPSYPNPPVYSKIYNNTMICAHRLSDDKWGSGINFLAGADYYEVKNNIIYNAGAYTVFHEDNPTPTHFIYNNNLYHLGYRYSGFRVNGAIINFTHWKALGKDINSPSPANPFFVNAAGGDYTLTSSSPAKWVGVNVGLLTDYIGKQVHNPPSIGAYEYVK